MITSNPTKNRWSYKLQVVRIHFVNGYERRLFSYNIVRIIVQESKKYILTFFLTFQKNRLVNKEQFSRLIFLNELCNG